MHFSTTLSRNALTFSEFTTVMTLFETILVTIALVVSDTFKNGGFPNNEQLSSNFCKN